MTSAKKAFGNSIGIHEVGYLTQKQYISANPKERFIVRQEASSTQRDLEHTRFYTPGPSLLTRKATLAYNYVAIHWAYLNRDSMLMVAFFVVDQLQVHKHC